MKKIIKMGLLSMLLLFVWACGSTTYQLSGKKYAAAVIENPGDLYSTYEFSKSDRKELIEQGLNDETIRQIEKMSREENWPKAIADLDGRLASRDLMKKYKTFKVAHVAGGDKLLLAIPAKSNKKMPENMRPAQDIFFVIGSKGVK